MPPHRSPAARRPVAVRGRAPAHGDPAGLVRVLTGSGLGALVVLLLVTAAPSLDPAYPGRSGANASAVESLDPEGHVPGGCVAMNPTRGDRGQTVLIDPGHGTPDVGSTGTTSSGRSFEEKDVTLPVALQAAGVLRDRGYRVALSRSTDAVGARIDDDDRTPGALTVSGIEKTLAARVACANLAGADAFVAVHFNAFDDPAVGGAETLYDPDRTFGEDNRRLAESLHDAMLRAYARTGAAVPDRGVLGGGGTAAADLVVLSARSPGSDEAQSEMPGAVVEPLFITDPQEADLVTSPAGQRTLATAIADGTESFLTDDESS